MQYLYPTNPYNIHQIIIMAKNSRAKIQTLHSPCSLDALSGVINTFLVGKLNCLAAILSSVETYKLQTHTLQIRTYTQSRLTDLTIYTYVVYRHWAASVTVIQLLIIVFYLDSSIIIYWLLHWLCISEMSLVYSVVSNMWIEHTIQWILSRWLVIPTWTKKVSRCVTFYYILLRLSRRRDWTME